MFRDLSMRWRDHLTGLGMPPMEIADKQDMDPRFLRGDTGET